MAEVLDRSLDYQTQAPQSSYFERMQEYAASQEAIEKQLYTRRSQGTLPVDMSYSQKIKMINDARYTAGTGYDNTVALRIQARERQVREMKARESYGYNALTAPTWLLGPLEGMALMPMMEAARSFGKFDANYVYSGIQMANTIDAFSGRTGMSGSTAAVISDLGNKMRDNISSQKGFFNANDATRISTIGAASGLINVSGSDAATKTKEYLRQFDELKKNTELVVKTLKTTLEGGMAVIKQLKDSGVRGTEIQSYIGKINAMGATTGIGFQGMQQVGQMGAQIAQGLGMSNNAGAAQAQMAYVGIHQQYVGDPKMRAYIDRVGGEASAAGIVASAGLNLINSKLGTRIWAATTNGDGSTNQDLMTKLSRGQLSGSDITYGSARRGHDMGQAGRFMSKWDKQDWWEGLSADQREDVNRGIFDTWAKRYRTAGSRRVKAYAYVENVLAPGADLNQQRLLAETLIRERDNSLFEAGEKVERDKRLMSNAVGSGYLKGSGLGSARFMVIGGAQIGAAVINSVSDELGMHIDQSFVSDFKKVGFYVSQTVGAAWNGVDKANYGKQKYNNEQYSERMRDLRGLGDFALKEHKSLVIARSKGFKTNTGEMTKAEQESELMRFGGSSQIKANAIMMSADQYNAAVQTVQMIATSSGEEALGRIQDKGPGSVGSLFGYTGQFKGTGSDAIKTAEAIGRTLKDLKPYMLEKRKERYDKYFGEDSEMNAFALSKINKDIDEARAKFGILSDRQIVGVFDRSSKEFEWSAAQKERNLDWYKSNKMGYSSKSELSDFVTSSNNRAFYEGKKEHAAGNLKYRFAHGLLSELTDVENGDRAFSDTTIKKIMLNYEKSGFDDTALGRILVKEQHLTVMQASQIIDELRPDRKAYFDADNNAQTANLAEREDAVQNRRLGKFIGRNKNAQGKKYSLGYVKNVLNGEIKQKTVDYGLLNKLSDDYGLDYKFSAKDKDLGKKVQDMKYDIETNTDAMSRSEFQNADDGDKLAEIRKNLGENTVAAIDDMFDPKKGLKGTMSTKDGVAQQMVYDDDNAKYKALMSRANDVITGTTSEANAGLTKGQAQNIKDAQKEANDKSGTDRIVNAINSAMGGRSGGGGGMSGAVQSPTLNYFNTAWSFSGR